MIEPKSVIRPIKVQFQGGMQPSDLAQYEVIVGAFSCYSSLFCHFLWCLFLFILSIFSGLFLFVLSKSCIFACRSAVFLQRIE